MPAVASAEPLLQMRGICKSFPGVQALQEVDLSLRRGEVLAILGENGAGKSTLIRMLGGAHRPDRGTIAMDGADVRLASPAEAFAAGIGVIYQEFNLVPALTAWENIFLGRENRLGRAQRRQERDAAAALFDQIGVSIPLDSPCENLSVAQQQIVEIAKALSHDVRLLVMDEPSAALTPVEVRKLFDIIGDLRSRGIAVIYISHRLDEIFEVADRVTVLRDGQHIGDRDIEELTRERLIEMMVGREIENEFPKHQHAIGTPRLVVSGLSRDQSVQDVSFHVSRGEVLGITGLVGAGRTETARLIFGADRANSGSIELDGTLLSIRNPRDAIRAGICLLTEDRKSQGILLQRSVLDNFALPNLDRLSTCGVVQQSQARSRFSEYVERLRIRIPHAQELAGNLSGGNQQKVVLAKWLERNAEVIIFDEPTRGIDVGARYEIYLLMNDLAQQGKAIIMISSELPEVLGMSDRILVMRGGRITGEISDMQTASQEQIMALAVG